LKKSVRERERRKRTAPSYVKALKWLVTLAQCVATDSTCPVRDGNIDRIRTMVKDAAQL
jgi:hypothetical protein